MTFKSEQEKKEYIQKVLDKLLYCPSFKMELDTVMLKYDIPKSVKIKYKVEEFDYSRTN